MKLGTVLKSIPTEIVSGLFCVHRTHMRPWPMMQVGGTEIDLSTRKRTAAPVPFRMTIHWSFNHFRPNLAYKIGKLLLPAQFADHTYIAIEPLSSLQDHIVGGWVDDLYMIGPYELSKESILIAPECEVSEIEKLGFAGTILSYNTAASETAEQVLIECIHNQTRELRLSTRFAPNSNLAHLNTKFGGKLVSVLKQLDVYNKVTTDFYCNSGVTYPISVEKWPSGYVFRTNNSGNSINRQFAQAVQDSGNEAGVTRLSYSDLDQNFTLESCFKNAKWLTVDHPGSPFMSLEKAISDRNFKKAEQLLQDICKFILADSEKHHKLKAFVQLLEQHTGYHFSLDGDCLSGLRGTFFWQLKTDAVEGSSKYPSC